MTKSFKLIMSMKCQRVV